MISVDELEASIRNLPATRAGLALQADKKASLAQSLGWMR